MIYTIPEDASEKALTLLKHKIMDVETLRDSMDRRYRRKRFHIMGLKGRAQFPFFPDELPREWFYAADGTRIEYERDLYRLYADRVLTFSVEPLKEARIERGGFIPSDM
ncbi:MAG: hypothetical protein J5758_03615, partial [Abditibacteriota bacterium]|nr:hypothetical protein [Abditibacteriota bacterium]